MGVTVYTPEIVERIVTGISEGQTLRQLCRDIGIGKSTWYAWCAEHPELSTPEFAGRIARARVLGFDEIAEECIDIADDRSHDYIKDDDGHRVFDSEHVQRAKMRIETRLKLLAKWDPKRYGDKLQTENDTKITVTLVDPFKHD
jgi:hypothetical protein